MFDAESETVLACETVRMRIGVVQRRIHTCACLDVHIPESADAAAMYLVKITAAANIVPPMMTAIAIHSEPMSLETFL